MSLPGMDSAAPAGVERVQAARLASRLTMSFLLDMVSLARGERHVLDTLLISATLQANLAPIQRQGDLQVTYSGVDEAPPDELRRPVSVNALANSLGLPFETVRRRVKGLLAQGVFVQVEAGLIVPSAYLSAPEQVKNGLLGYERLRRFYYDLRDLGLIGALAPPSVRMEGGALPMRTAMRHASAFVLRIIEIMMRHEGDALNVLIMLQVFCANTEDFTSDMIGGDTLEPRDMVRDNLRKPVRPTTLARRLGLPGETIRRHLEDMIARGTLIRVQGGLILPAETLARSNVRAGMFDNIANLQRLFSGLSQLGVLAIWDQLSPVATKTASSAVIARPAQASIKSA
jgi:DNA-binding Lrp family transcriptional regulator